jgi:hypothetical protein
MAIWYILVVIWCIFPILDFCTKLNLATLARQRDCPNKVNEQKEGVAKLYFVDTQITDSQKFQHPNS